jgi:N6-L-threonylcarbamoyladenine synthase
MRILAFETSCDETAVAIVRDDRTVEYSVVSSQIDLHRPFGGVVPEVASRAHQEWLPLLTRQALDETGFGPNDFDAIAATRGPGLIGALLVGVSFSKALSLAWDLPWVGINHLEGHLASLQLADPTFEPPFVALLVSGGHTEYVDVDAKRNVRFLGGTLDDAAGEAFDKVAHLLGLGYPGGPAIQAAAERYKGNDLHPLPVPMKGRPGCDISFSGLKTAVAVAIEKENGWMDAAKAARWAASFQRVAVEALLNKLEAAADEAGRRRIALAGGVAANGELRASANRLARRRGFELGIVPLEYCGDNAAMIGVAALTKLERGDGISTLADADPNLSLRDGNP